MVKKKIKRRLSKSKNNVKSQPLHFSKLNFDKKVISIILIVLIIGIIASVIPGDKITGMGPGPVPGFVPGSSSDTSTSSLNTFEGVFAPLRGFLKEFNLFILDVFGTLYNLDKETHEDKEIIYVMFLLFVAVTIVVYLFSRQFTDNAFVGLILGIAVAYISTFLMPKDTVLAIGLLYQSALVSIIVLLIIGIFWWFILKVDRTTIGYITKCTILAIMFLLMTATPVGGTTTGIVSGISRAIEIMIIVVMIYFIYSFIMIFIASGRDIKATKKHLRKALQVETKATILTELVEALKKKKKK